MQDLVSLFCADDLLHQRLCLRFSGQVVKTEENPPSAFVAQSHVPCCFIEVNPDYREALYLTYFEGMSYQQAAEVMGKSVKQITNMVYRGKERLRGLLKREGITNAER